MPSTPISPSVRNASCGDWPASSICATCGASRVVTTSRTVPITARCSSLSRIRRAGIVTLPVRLVRRAIQDTDGTFHGSADRRHCIALTGVNEFSH